MTGPIMRRHNVLAAAAASFQKASPLRSPKEKVLHKVLHKDKEKESQPPREEQLQQEKA